jgi:hypothetical protein
MENTRRRSSAGNASEQASSKPKGSIQGEGRVSRLFQDEEKRVTEKAARGFLPFRFWNEKGEECEVTILDSSIEEAFARPEHNIQGSDGKWGNIVPCVRNEAECPLCKTNKESTVVLYLSVIVHRPYTSKKTGETRNHSKMFLCLKRGQFNDFQRIEAIAVKKYGTLRGTTILLARDNDKTSYSTGMPIAGDDGNLIIDWYDEAGLAKFFGNKEVKNREGDKILKKKNEDIEVYDYRKLMPPPDIDEFLEEFGDGPAAGSKKAHSSYKDDDEGEEQPARRRRSSNSTEEAETAQSGRRRSSSAAEEEAPAPARRRASTAVEEDDGEPEPAPRRARSAASQTKSVEEAEEEPKPRRRAASTPAPKHVAPDEDDGDDIPFGD